MLVKPSTYTTVIDLSFEEIQSLDEAIATQKIEQFVSRHFDFEKPEQPQVKKYMNYISIAYRSEKHDLENLFAYALALHESTQGLS